MKVTTSLFSRLLRASSEFTTPVRSRYVDAAGNPRKPIKVHDLKVVINPDESLIDEFMKRYGKERLNFKREEFKIWRECFKDRYGMVFVILRGSNRIVHTSHYINYYPVAPFVDTPHQYQGFFWIDPDFRGADTMQMSDYMCKKLARNVSDNVIAQCMVHSMDAWKMMFGHKNYGHVQNVSYYKPDEMRVPENMNFDGIFIKNATEVADQDIVKYDQKVFPYERSKYVLSLLRDPDGFGKVAYDENGNVIGIGSVLIYPSGECVLTPLYAEGKRVAQAIFKSILQEIPLNDKKLLRFQIRSIDKNEDGFDWIQPFVKNPIRKEPMGYLTYVTHLPSVNYKKVFANTPYTCAAI